MTTQDLQITNLELIEKWEQEQEEEFKIKLKELQIKFNSKN